MIPMIYFRILRIFLRKILKRGKLKIWAKRAPTPQRREPTPKCGMPCRCENEVKKLALLRYTAT